MDGWKKGQICVSVHARFTSNQLQPSVFFLSTSLALIRRLPTTIAYSTQYRSIEEPRNRGTEFYCQEDFRAITTAKEAQKIEKIEIKFSYQTHKAYTEHLKLNTEREH